MNTTAHRPPPAQPQAVLSRRRFLSASSTLAAGISVVPAHVLGGEGQAAPNSRLNLAFVGVGSQGLRVMLGMLKEPDVQAIAVCDPVRIAVDYPQWSESEFRDSVRRLLGTDSGWDFLSPNRPIDLTPSLRVTSGVAGREPCQMIVDASNAKRSSTERSRGCRAYIDFRDLLAEQKDLDGVVIGTPDHLHAAIAVAAMKAGKHVFCQKPMAHSIHEARRMAAVAKQTGVVTQVAVGPQASEDTRRLIEWVAAGAIGPVRQVINWSSRPFWPQGLERPKEGQPVPEGIDWNLWLGPAPERPFHRIYLPFVWRGWTDFGCGAFGDMGCYSFDTIFRVLGLNAPVAVEASSTRRFPETFPLASVVHLDFAPRGSKPPVRLTWYDGGLRPPRPTALDGKTPLDDEGLLFFGDEGTILADFVGGKPHLIPEARQKSFREPPKTLPRSPGNEREWLDACKDRILKTGANFEFSAVVTEALALANMAVQTGQRIEWDAEALHLEGPAAAQGMINPPARIGWGV
jgi:predicted dehydrogenase